MWVIIRKKPQNRERENPGPCSKAYFFVITLGETKDKKKGGWSKAGKQ